ncbi:MAG: amidohydrolase family protein [bacterium]|nr:amidohydrolase family protein [bacterium]
MKIFDSHFHIIDPQFPLQPNQGFIPEPYLVNNYKSETSEHDIAGGAVVSGSFQGFDTSSLIEFLKILGNGFYGVANISSELGDDELVKLDQAGVRAVRFNLKRGGSAERDEMVNLSNRLFDKFGWHAELYVSSKELISLSSMLSEIPEYSIDHLGLEKFGLEHLFKCVEQGAKVKATGFGRVDFDPKEVMKTIHSINTTALMFGTDLPSTRARERYSKAHLDLIKDTFDSSDLDRILYRNALGFYTKVNR